MTNSNEYGSRDMVGYGEMTPDPKWPNGAKIAVSLVLNYEEGSEVSVYEVVDTGKLGELIPLRLSSLLRNGAMNRPKRRLVRN